MPPRGWLGCWRRGVGSGSVGGGGGGPRSVASVVAIWAVAKTGAGFVPVDPGYPGERITHMLTDSGVRLGVTTSDTVLPDTGVDWLLLDDLDTTPARCSTRSGYARRIRRT